MARITLEQARTFAAKRGNGVQTVTALKYLELADGDETLAGLIADYYTGTGYAKPFSVGKLIRDYWTHKAETA